MAVLARLFGFDTVAKTTAPHSRMIGYKNRVWCLVIKCRRVCENGSQFYPDSEQEDNHSMGDNRLSPEYPALSRRGRGNWIDRLEPGKPQSVRSQQPPRLSEVWLTQATVDHSYRIAHPLPLNGPLRKLDTEGMCS